MKTIKDFFLNTWLLSLVLSSWLVLFSNSAYAVPKACTGVTAPSPATSASTAECYCTGAGTTFKVIANRSTDKISQIQPTTGDNRICQGKSTNCSTLALNTQLTSGSAAVTYYFNGSNGTDRFYWSCSYNGSRFNNAASINPASSIGFFPDIIIDNDTLSTSEAEGIATFKLKLGTQPTNDVTLNLVANDSSEGTLSPSSVTFTSSNWDQAQTITVTGKRDGIDDGDIDYAIQFTKITSLDTNYNGHTPTQIVAVRNIDIDPVGVTIDPQTGLKTTEAGGEASFKVTLTAPPSGDVKLGLSSANANEGTATPAELTFTPLNWNQAQTVTITGVDDALVDGDQSYSIITAPLVSSDTAYHNLNPADVSVSNTDDDVVGVTITPSTVLETTEAGGAATFTVKLTSQPSSNVNLTLASSKATEGTLDLSLLTFTPSNWHQAQTVTIKGVDDFIQDGDIAYSIITEPLSGTDIQYQDLNPNDISVKNLDNDVAGISLSADTKLTTEAGASASLAVKLKSQPLADVEINLAITDTSEASLDLKKLVFTATNWNQVQTVVVTGADDNVIDGTQTYAVSLNATSTDPHYTNSQTSLELQNSDNDSAGIMVTPITGLTTNEAGDTASFTIKLNSQPSADVSIQLSSSNAAEGTINPSSVTFTSSNWNQAQTITITGVDDQLVDGTKDYSIVTAAAVSTDANYAGLDAEDVAVKNIDNDSAGITVMPSSGLSTTEAGDTASFTIKLNSEPSTDVSIQLSSSNSAEGTIGPSSVTFTSSNWNQAQTITITGVDDQSIDGTQDYSIITAAAISTDPSYNGLNADDVIVTNADNDTYNLSITKLKDGAEQNNGLATPAEFIITVTPANNSTQAITGQLTWTGIATAGMDYELAPIQFSIPAGSSSTKLMINIIEDSEVEPSETLIATMSAPSIGSITTDTASATIQDDDPAKTIFEVLGKDTLISNGDTSPTIIDATDFGTLDILDGRETHTFTVRNNTDKPITITALELLEDNVEAANSLQWLGIQTVLAAGASDFNLQTGMPVTIPAQSSRDFELSFDPSEIGLRTAKVNIHLESGELYSFLISGTGTSKAVNIPIFYPSSLVILILSLLGFGLFQRKLS